MNIIEELNSEFQIEVKNHIAYDLQDGKNIIAKNEKELIKFYIESFKHKIECLFNDETETRKHYENIIEQLEGLADKEAASYQIPKGKK